MFKTWTRSPVNYLGLVSHLFESLNSWFSTWKSQYEPEQTPVMSWCMLRGLFLLNYDTCHSVFIIILLKSSVWQSAALQLSHLTHWTLHDIHLEVQVIGCLQEALRGLDVKTSCRSCTLTIRNIYRLVLNAVKNVHIAGVLTSYVQKQRLSGADTFCQREAGRVSPPVSKSFHLWPLSQRTSWESSSVSCVALCSSQSWRD